jgi:hypothetical protein
MGNVGEIKRRLVGALIGALISGIGSAHAQDQFNGQGDAEPQAAAPDQGANYWATQQPHVTIAPDACHPNFNMQTAAGQAAAEAAAPQTARACLQQRCAHNPDLEGCIAQGGEIPGSTVATTHPLGWTPKATPAAKKATVVANAKAPPASKWGKNAKVEGANLIVTGPTGAKFTLPLSQPVLMPDGRTEVGNLTSFQVGAQPGNAYLKGIAGFYQGTVSGVQSVPVAGTMISSP